MSYDDDMEGRKRRGDAEISLVDSKSKSTTPRMYTANSENDDEDDYDGGIVDDQDELSSEDQLYILQQKLAEKERKKALLAERERLRYELAQFHTNPSEQRHNTPKLEDARPKISSKKAELLAEKARLTALLANGEQRDQTAEQRPPSLEEAESSDVKMQADMKKKRSLVITEIRATERDFVSDLEVIVNVFLKPLLDRKLILLREVTAIFAVRVGCYYYYYYCFYFIH